MEVDTNKEPAEGEVLVFTSSGGFLVRGHVKEVAGKLSSDEWATFELAETGDEVMIRSKQVVALREGRRAHRGAIGFVHGQSS